MPVLPKNVQSLDKLEEMESYGTVRVHARQLTQNTANVIPPPTPSKKSSLISASRSVNVRETK